MKNKLGHDDASEISTVIKRMQENKFSVLNAENNNKFIFEIKLTHLTSVTVPNHEYTTVQYMIEREGISDAYKYLFYQIDGKPLREIPTNDGFIIWRILEEKIMFLEGNFYKRSETLCHSLRFKIIEEKIRVEKIMDHYYRKSIPENEPVFTTSQEMDINSLIDDGLTVEEILSEIRKW